MNYNTIPDLRSTVYLMLERVFLLTPKKFTFNFWNVPLTFNVENGIWTPKQGTPKNFPLLILSGLPFGTPTPGGVVLLSWFDGQIVTWSWSVWSHSYGQLNWNFAAPPLTVGALNGCFNHLNTAPAQETPTKTAITWTTVDSHWREALRSYSTEPTNS